MPSSATIYVDESGDLGWNFDLPYREGGSSRYLTIAAVIASLATSKHASRLIRNLYTSRKWNPNKEKKWVKMIPSAREDFALRATALSQERSGINYRTITVYKPNVQDHIRRDGNKLYNYMIGLLLLSHIQRFDRVTFIPDERTIKVASGNSLHDYLQTQLWFELGRSTELITKPGESNAYKGLQFSDMLAGCVQSHFEDEDSSAFHLVRPTITLKRLYFP